MSVVVRHKKPILKYAVLSGVLVAIATLLYIATSSRAITMTNTSHPVHNTKDTDRVIGNRGGIVAGLLVLISSGALALNRK